MRLIDADALLKEMGNYIQDRIITDFDMTATILDAPTIDAVVATEEYEWCTECKEYDQEKHCCPRWNRFIRKTVEELEEHYKPKRGEWIVHESRTVVDEGFVDFYPTEYECSNCGSKESQMRSFCPNCGADMREREGE